MSKRVLVIAAHPDDEVLGVGGTIVRLVENGFEAHVLFATTGITARYADQEAYADSIQTQITQLKRDVASTKEILGIHTHYFLEYPDNRLDTVALMDLTHSIRGIVQEVQPKIVFTHHHGDYNWDHRIVFEATLMACRANAGETYPELLYAYEVLSSTERNLQNAAFGFFPNVYVDVTHSIEQKIAALQCYSTELGKYPHPRSAEAVRNKALCRGSEVNMKYAEAFHLIRQLHGERVCV